MKKFTTVITIFLLALATYWSFSSAMPSYQKNETVPLNSFSTDRALAHVKKIAEAPHAVGFPAHKEVRDYIVCELQKMGLKTSLQEGYTAGDWANLSKATNILARIPGTEQGKALLVLSHYDSSPHSSLGASDAGSGVATILEGIRAFLSENKNPKNDVIILISDAEELGLNGADLFANKHPWANDVGLVLNFEARGSGGPSFMLIETNRGNSRLIEEFTAASPEFPVANSLVYSIYKMLPNDTDLTVFREDRDIEGLNFAFADDHFDYHTVRDNFDRLDRNTLAHQGSYLMPLLMHFSNADLGNLKSLNDDVYFTVPFFKLISYPFEWIWLMFGLALLSFVCLLVYGFKKQSLHLKEIFKGFLPMGISLLINGVVGYFSWTLLKWFYPQYQDILHGFTYNGYYYITAFVFLSIAVCFGAYHKFQNISVSNLVISPITLWLIICGAVAYYLPGASFFIIPLYALLACLFILVNQKIPNPYLLVFLALPALWIYTPFIKMFPVGLGLKMMVASTVLTTLTFYLLLPVFGFYKSKGKLAFLCQFLFAIFMVVAHFNSGFTKDHAKPSSLLYILNTDNNSAHWVSYDHELIAWNKKYVDGPSKNQVDYQIISSKYAPGFTYSSKAPIIEIPPPSVEKTFDTIVGENRLVKLIITPQRSVNRLEVFTNNVPLSTVTVNEIELSPFYLKDLKRSKLLTHYISDNDATTLELQFPKNQVLELQIYEASNDLLNHPLFSVPERPETSIPMPFILNDAILTTKTIRLE
ncbi:M28 family peptidase [Sediminicola arcticus]|uniref:Vacuolar membrane protease n=1 Tax=Sediminicola arcticus TaxID=1574308 RepID=A0ABV2SVI4_9FLAO